MGENLNKLRRQELERKCNQNYPLALVDVRKMSKDDLMCAILLREIRFKKMQDEWQSAVKDNRIREYLIEQLALVSSRQKKAQILMRLLKVKS